MRTVQTQNRFGWPFILTTLRWLCLSAFRVVPFFKQAVCRSLAPLGDRILVRKAAKETQTASGIYLPADKTKSPNEGEVIAVGAGIRDVSGNLHAPILKVGDTVLLPTYGGTEVKVDGEELHLFREDDILGKFE